MWISTAAEAASFAFLFENHFQRRSHVISHGTMYLIVLRICHIVTTRNTFQQKNMIPENISEMFFGEKDAHVCVCVCVGRQSICQSKIANIADDKVLWVWRECVCAVCALWQIYFLVSPICNLIFLFSCSLFSIYSPYYTRFDALKRFEHLRQAIGITKLFNNLLHVRWK